jgi:L-ascorbate metabolism protein UlaG (beta-lactamase superfamily)
MAAEPFPHDTLRVTGSASLEPPDGALTFIGTATVLLEVGGLRILTDPNFLHQGEHAKLGWGLRSRRLTEPARSLGELLPVDLVVLSHHHGDHFDEVSARELPATVPIVTTPHAARKLRRQGFTSTWPLETWQRQRVAHPRGSLTITSLPARHAPQPVRHLLPPVMGSMLDVEADGHAHRTYLTGDTLLHDDLAEIPRRHPGIDLAVVHIGGTRIAGVTLTMTGEQGVRAVELVDPDHAVPVHYDDYRVFRSPRSDFEEEARRRDLRTQVHYLDRGDTLDLAMRRTTAGEPT